MKNKIFKTSDSLSPFIVRVVLGAVVLPHGVQKLFGWFGGYGFEGTMNFFLNKVGLPWIIGFFVIMLETLGALILIAGIGTRVVALCYTFLAVGIIFTSSLQYGFFMNWFGNQAGEGYEYFLLWLGMSVSLIITGAGQYSIDKLLITNKG